MDEKSEGKQSFDIKSCSMHSVVVYKDRAEVRRNLPLRLEAGGETEVLLTGLSSSIDSDSIRVEGSGNATILDVIYETKSEEPLDNDGKKEEIDGLSEEIKDKKKELTTIEFQQMLIDRQKTILTEFSGHVTSRVQDKKKEEGADGIFQSTVHPEAVNGVMEFMARFEEKMSSLDERYLELSTQKKKMEEELKVLTTKLDNLNSSYQGKETIRSVKVILHSIEKVDVTLVVSYVVKNASWSPIYDIRVFTKDKTLKTHYYGLIKQSTGEDWDNASISLSTAQPDVGGSPPSLGVHHIGFERARYVTRSYKKKAGFNFISSYGGDSASDDDEWFEDDSDKMMNAGFTGLELCAVPDIPLDGGSPVAKRKAAKAPSLEVDVSKVETGQLYNALFSIPRTSTIPSDNTEHK
uniref:DUF4139 domain-containing protein n=1 Tax=Amphimedon queenslandica TaxID=400682 RepID=A0A1X7VAE9_AMPQE